MGLTVNIFKQSSENYLRIPCITERYRVHTFDGEYIGINCKVWIHTSTPTTQPSVLEEDKALVLTTMRHV